MTSATSPGYQMKTEYHSFHMRCYLFKDENCGHHRATFQNGRIPSPTSLFTQKAHPQWHSRVQSSPKMISPLFRQTQKCLGCLEIRNLILKMKILVSCAQIWLELKNLQKTARKQCFLPVFWSSFISN